MSTYIEISSYAFEHTEDGTVPIQHPNTKPDGWCVYVLERDCETDEYVNDFEDEDFDTEDEAGAFVQKMLEKYPDAVENPY